MTLKQKLIEELTQNPGQQTRQLASKLQEDRQEINRLLYGPLKGSFNQDRSYRWWPRTQASHQDAGHPQGAQYAQTPLSRLARYYLACLSQDDVGEVSAWARPFGNDADYVALDTLPLEDLGAQLQYPAASQLMNKMYRDRNAKILYLGYPVVLNRFLSKAGNEIYRLEPLFLIPIQFEQANNRGPAYLSRDFPLINTAVLKRFTNADRDSLMDEMLVLEDELGFADTADVPEMDELIQRLQAIRPEWPWLENCDAMCLEKSPGIPELSEPGIYNRAVFMLAERKPYTQGLETELRDLATLDEAAYRQTALGQLVNDTVTARPPEGEEPALLEVLPLNLEQRTAISRALSQSLTVITGPPGTGKSQVVTNLLINAAWQGKKVLFASKNNKAVDVVEARVNNIGTRPVLLRMGSNAYQIKLKEYLQALLSATASEDEKIEYEYCANKHSELIAEVEKVKEQQLLLIEKRNTVDHLEQLVESHRENLSADVFASMGKLDLAEVTQLLSAYGEELNKADKARQGLINRLFWSMIRKKRFAALAEHHNALFPILAPIGIEAPSSVISDDSIREYRALHDQLTELLQKAREVRRYFDALKTLQTLPSLESLNAKLRDINEAISKNSEKLWQGWLKVSPARLTPEDRSLLSRYASVLQMIIDSSNARVQPSVWRQYYELTEKVSYLLPCWAVTSLSARGKLPFTAGYYDLVVIDEASQCDIASALPLLYRAKQAVVIGDPKQLSHISSIHKGQDMQLLDRHELTEQFLQWAYSWNSLFDMVRSYAATEDIVNLRDHHRSHADIISFSNQYFYGDNLRIATHYDKLQRPTPNSPGVRWLEITGKTIRPKNGSAINQPEAEAVVAELRRLVLEQRYAGSVGVVTPFRAQANLIKDLCYKDTVLWRLLEEKAFISDTVHRFQGDERDLIIFSPVVSQGAGHATTAFLKRGGNLFNVAITRARAMLLVVGDMEAARSSNVEYLSEFARYVENLTEEKIKTEMHLRENHGPDYPATVDRSKVSDWEIVLYKALYQAGIATIPQYPVEQYLLDFALIHNDRRLDIEVDGERYHRLWTGEYCRRDQIRNQRMYELGWDVLRFWVYEIRDDLPGCIRRVEAWLNNSHG